MSNMAFVVALRLVGIWIVLNWGFQALGLILTLTRGVDFLNVVISFGIVATWLTFGIALLVRPVAFGQLLVPGGVRGGGPTPWSVEQFQSVAFRVLGLYLIATALTSGVIWTSVLGGFLENRPASNSIDVIDIAQTAVKILIGAWLLFGAKGLVELLRFAHRADQAESEESDETRETV